MGTPEFAVPALSNIVLSGRHEVSAVFTAAPKACGRGMLVTKSAVHQKALDYLLPVFTPTRITSAESLDLLSEIDADVIVVVAYGFLIPKSVLDLKKFGCLNVHPSKLPKYRGAAPLQCTIINGDLETAVCVMQMDEGLDTGDIILQRDIILSDRITLSSLHDLCANIGAEMLVRVLDQIESLPRIKQSSDGIIYAHKLQKSSGKVNWLESAYSIDCKVRGMNPWPGVYFEHCGNIIKIMESEYIDSSHSYEPGYIIDDNFFVACGNGILNIKMLQPSGKNIMSGADYLRTKKRTNCT